VGAIDDATSDPVAAVFRAQEDAAGYLELLREVVVTRGIPAAVYRDRHMIFEVSKRVRSTLEEDFAQQRFPTQVGRLLAELGIESIPAYSPQAKGRVQRSWRTQQDRLAAELRLAGVTTIEEANAFLPGYLARYRARFSVAPRSDQSAYVPIDPGTDLDRLFCFKYQRKVASDNTIQFDGQVLQIPPGLDRLSYARCVVEVQEWLDGSLAICYQGRQLLLVPARTLGQPLRARKRHFYNAEGAAVPRPIQEGASGPSSGPWESEEHAPEAATNPSALSTALPPVTATQPAAASPRHKPSPDHPWRRAIRADVHTRADIFTPG